MSHPAEAQTSFVPGEGDPQPGSTLAIVLMGFALVFITILALQTLFYRARDREFVEKTYGPPPVELIELRADQLRKISEYHWVDQASGTVGIPIDRAMEMVRLEARALAPAVEDVQK